MNEKDWLACEDPDQMLEFLRGMASDRKLRLFAVACCYRVSPYIPSERNIEAIEVLERFADGLANDKERKYVHGWNRILAISNAASPSVTEAAYYAAGAASAIYASATVHDSTNATWHTSERAERVEQARLLRDLFGSFPLRPVTLDPITLRWNSGTVLKLAEQIYEKRRFTDLPILADALEEAGCQDTAILEHCRGPGPHVRGCWALDLILGKE